MPYMVTGNAQQIFQAFGQEWIVAEGKDDSGTIRLDFSRTHFMGTPEDAINHVGVWSRNASGRYYLQGNMSAGNLHYLLGPAPLMLENEGPESYNANILRQHFAYVNEQGEPCGLLLMCRKDNPGQWIVGFVKNGYAEPKDRELVFLSSFDLAPFITPPQQQPNSLAVTPPVTVTRIEVADNPLITKLGADLPRQLLKNLLHPETGMMDLRCQRLELIVRTIRLDQDSVRLNNPVPFTELNLTALFADNPALDLMVQYRFASLFPWSSLLLHDLLLEPSSLRQEIEALVLTEDEKRNKNLLKMVLVFYKHGLLETHRHLLHDPALLQKFGPLMDDEMQIKLLPFLKQQQYSDELIEQILSNPAYFKTINMLVDLKPTLTEEVPQFFKNPKKLEDLQFIHSLANPDVERLCLLFWVKHDLSADGYQQIITAASRYPLLASTLVALEQTKKIEQLQALALNPSQHLRKSILHHFHAEFENLQASSTSLRRLSQRELEAASQALIILKNANIADPQSYRLVLNKDSKGQALRLLLPQLTTISNDAERKILVEMLLVGAKFNVQVQDKRVHAITEPESLKELALELHGCFKCVVQLQDFMLADDMIEFAAQKDTEEARRFRQVILCILEQCKIIDARLSGERSSRTMFLQWEQEQKNYRRLLYQIAYDGLTNPNANTRARLQEAEQNILAIVDPEIDSALYKALLVFANIVISAVSLGLANVIKYKTTGNFWFFHQTRSGEELRALDKEILGLIAPEKTSEPDLCGGAFLSWRPH